MKKRQKKDPFEETVTRIVGKQLYAVTGTVHEEMVEAKNEGEARRIFHNYHNGESVTQVKNLPWRAIL